MSGKACCGSSSQKVKVKKVNSCCSSATHEDMSANLEPSCCGSGNSCCKASHIEAPWITGYIKTEAGEVPQVSTELSFTDKFGSFKCRLSIGRMNYRIEPGIYAVGSPEKTSPVLVTANYKLTFDKVRAQLCDLDAWIIVLDTDGINVWCAAGKGTFGTDEVVSRIRAVGLGQIVEHRTIILPQLGATGVAAHEVKKRTGFHVVYGPVRAEDLKAFISAGMVATDEMRTVQFTFIDRFIFDAGRASLPAAQASHRFRGIVHPEHYWLWALWHH